MRPNGTNGAVRRVTQHIMQEHFMADRALADIARELGQKPSTVRVRLHRGCRRLRDQLAV